MARGPAEPSALVRYYERLSGLLLPARRRLGIMHRAIHEGRRDRKRSLLFVSSRIVDALRRYAPGDAARPLRALDLGCGLGGTAEIVANGIGADIYGVTLSHRQAVAFARRAHRTGRGEHLHVAVADFHTLPFGSASFDAAWAIESFVHSRHPARWFREARSVVRTGGILVVCDDFRSPTASGVPTARVLLHRFRRGWLLGSVPSRARFLALAERAGFRCVREEDLSPLVRARWPLGSLAVMPLGLVSLPGWPGRMLSASGARELATRRGWLDYRLFVLRRDG